MKSNVLFVLTAGVVLAASALIAASPDNENAIQQSKKLAGAWSATSVVRNRNELPAEKLTDLQIIFRDGRFALKQGDKTLTEGTFQLDPAKMPRTIDLTTTDANGADRTTLAVYDLTEDTLRICGAPPGAERPSEFAALDGSGHTLTTFQRVK